MDPWEITCWAMFIMRIYQSFSDSGVLSPMPFSPTSARNWSAWRWAKPQTRGRLSRKPFAERFGGLLCSTSVVFLSLGSVVTCPKPSVSLLYAPDFHSLIVPSTDNVGALFNYPYIFLPIHFFQTLFVANKSKTSAVASPFVVGERPDCASSKHIVTIFHQSHYTCAHTRPESYHKCSYSCVRDVRREYWFLHRVKDTIWLGFGRQSASAVRNS